MRWSPSTRPWRTRRNALRLLLGVGSVVIGEFAAVTLGGGYAPLALATFIAMVIAKGLGGAPIVMAQAAVSAILTVTTADDDFGVNRLVDAAIGGGVALLFSQVLFSPEPVGLLRRSEVTALTGMADGLEMTAQALEDASAEPRRAQPLPGCARLRDSLAELSRLRHAGYAWHATLQFGVRKWPRLSAKPRMLRVPLEAGGWKLPDAGARCRRVARAGPSYVGASRSRLSAILAALAAELGMHATRQGAADERWKPLRQFASGKDSATPSP